MKTIHIIEPHDPVPYRFPEPPPTPEYTGSAGHWDWSYGPHHGTVEENPRDPRRALRVAWATTCPDDWKEIEDIIIRNLPS